MEYDIIIIGGGPAGYTAAVRAGQLGLKTAVIERKHIGGMCLNWGCIPTKSIIESARMLQRVKHANEFGIDGIDIKKLVFNWSNVKIRAQKIIKSLTSGVDVLLEKSGVELIIGEARITGQDSVTVENRRLKTKNILIATGSFPKALDLPVDPKIVVSIDRLFELKSLPEKVVVFGKGGVALEMAQFFRMAGSEVALLAPDADIIPGADTFLINYAKKMLNDTGVQIHITKSVRSYIDGNLIIGKKQIPCDMIVNASWRGAVLPPSDPEIELTGDGYIKTEMDFVTSVPGIFAIGDVNGKSYLAHVASAQGIWVINHIKGIRNEFNLNNYPLNLYTTPEIAQIGMTEQMIKEEGIEYKVNEHPLTANGKALAEGNSEGFIRILSEKRYGQVIGVQIVAANASDMISEAAAFMQIEGTVYDVAQTIHAHPTVSEIYMEAGFDAVDKTFKE